MIDWFLKVVGLQWRIEDHPVNFEIETPCPVCKGTGKFKFGGLLKLDFPDKKKKK